MGSDLFNDRLGRIEVALGPSAKSWHTDGQGAANRPIERSASLAVERSHDEPSKGAHQIWCHPRKFTLLSWASLGLTIITVVVISSSRGGRERLGSVIGFPNTKVSRLFPHQSFDKPVGRRNGFDTTSRKDLSFREVGIN